MTPTSLAATEFLQGCDLKTLQELMAGFTPVHLPDGVALFRQGDSGTAMYLIISGRLRMETTLEQGGEAPADEIGPGDVAGEIPVLVGGAHSSTVTAVGDAILAEISKEVFDRLVARHPEMLSRARELARQRLRRHKLACVLHILFGPLDQAARRRIEAEVEWVVVPCGAALFRRVEASESLYFLVSGRMLAVVDDEHGKERMGAEITPGESVGEMGFLADRPHSKSVYAIRDSTLAEFSRESFNRLLEQYPQALRQISRLAIRSLEPTPPAAPSEAETIHVAVIPLGPDVPVAEFSRRLVNALAAHGAPLHVEREMISRRVGARSVTTTSLDSPALIRLPSATLAAFLWLAGAVLGRYAPGLHTSGAQMFVYGFVVSTVLVYHATFIVNSLGHRFGTRPFRIADNSRNNFWIALITLGDGYHNNHHYYPASARHGFYWREPDVSYYLLRGLAVMGLVWGIQKPPSHIYRRGR
jgi:CRP-like cAMP-binding protein